MGPEPTDINSSLISPLRPHVLVLFGATGDLARRKLLPGLLHLLQAGLMPECRILGTSLETFDDESFRRFARSACDEFSVRPISDAEWAAFDDKLSYVPQAAGPARLARAVTRLEQSIGGTVRRLHYLSVPPAAARQVVDTLDKAGLVARSRIIMEKPFGTDLASARALNSFLHETFSEDQVFRIDHFL